MYFQTKQKENNTHAARKQTQSVVLDNTTRCFVENIVAF